MEDKLYGPLATVVAASIAAFIGLLSLVVSKEAKISEFRQKWIDELRSEISALLANAYQSLRFQVRDDDSKFAKENDEAILAANTALALIKLRLNEREEASKNLLNVLERIVEYSAQNQFDGDEISKLEAELTEKSRKVLKSEWDRVRAGEVWFRIVRGTLGAIVLFLLIVAARIAWLEFG